MNYLALLIALIGYGAILYFILTEKKRRENEVKSIIRDIRSRGKITIEIEK